MGNSGSIRSILSVMLLAFFLNALLPFLSFHSIGSATAGPSVEDSAVPGIDLLYANQILICTPEGYKWVSKFEFQNSTSSGPSSVENHCPLCSLSFNSPMLAVFLLVHLFDYDDLGKTASFPIITDIVGFNQLEIRGSHSRAPPATL